MSAPCPWKPPGEGGRWTLGNADGQLIFVVVGGYEPAVSTQNGMSPAVRANVVILTGPEAGTEVLDVLIFNTRVVQRLRASAPGDVVLGGVSVEERGNRAVDLYDPGPAAAPYAEAWHNAHPGRLSELGQLAIQAFRAAQTGGNVNMSAPRPAQPAAPQWAPQPAAPSGWNGGAAQPAMPVAPPQPAPPQPATPWAQPPMQPGGAPAWSHSIIPGVPPATPQQAGF